MHYMLTTLLILLAGHAAIAWQVTTTEPCDFDTCEGGNHATRY